MTTLKRYTSSYGLVTNHYALAEDPTGEYVLFSEANKIEQERDALHKLSFSGMTFDILRAANKERLPLFKNAKGGLAHSEPDGSDWSPAQWLQAVVGELGEYANIRKKFERGDLSMDEFMPLAAKELADVQIYLDILAAQLHINLGEATRQKFNEVSRRINCDVMIEYPGIPPID
ncbi:MAG: MazG-like family protein [Sulfobacillus sp.]